MFADLSVGFQYYRYTHKLGVAVGYPKPLNLWRGLPMQSTISAAVNVANSATYFFTGQYFYRYNDVAFHVRNRQQIISWPATMWGQL